MKYSYDREFKKIAIGMPFYGFLCKKAQGPLEKMLDKLDTPSEVSIREIEVNGYRNDKIKIKEITPEITSDAAVLVIHGGGFGYKMAPYQLLNACRYAIELGCKAFAPDYHLIPDHPFPAAYEDCMMTYEYMVSNAEKLGIKSDKIIVLGDSAGGALAANVCNTAQSRGLPMPCCQILIYPVTDSAMHTESMKKFPDTPLWNAKNNKRMWKLYLNGVSEQEKEIAVPMNNPLPEKLPPTYVELTEFDCLHDEGLLYAEHIRDIAECVVINETKGTLHGYDNLQEHPITQDSLKKRIEFMKKYY